jgi:hypothetical protein
MTKQIRTSVAALAVIVAGSAFLSSPAAAAEAFFRCDMATMIVMSDAYCGGGDFTISNIQSDGDSCSWDVECH